jgi:hypothetical protein
MPVVEVRARCRRGRLGAQPERAVINPGVPDDFCYPSMLDVYG